MMTTDAPRSDSDEAAASTAPATVSSDTPDSPIAAPAPATTDDASIDGPTHEAAAESTGAAASEALPAADRHAVPPVAHADAPADGEVAGAPGTHVSVSADAVAEMPNEPPPTATAPPSATFDTPNTHAGEAPPLAEHAASVQEAPGGIPTGVESPLSANPVAEAPEAGLEGDAAGEGDAAASGDLTEQAAAAQQADEEASKPSLKDRMQSTASQTAVPVPTSSTAGDVPAAKGPVAVPRADEDSLDPALEAQITEQLSGTMMPESPNPQPSAGAEEPPTLTAAEQTAALAAGEVAAPGQRVEGTVTTIHGDSVFVDFGARLSGQIPTRQFLSDDLPKVGDKLELVIQSVDEAEGVITCSRPGSKVSAKRANWDEVSEGQVVDARVTKRNKGGLEVSIGSLRGFMPASQVDAGYVADLEQFVGQTVQTRVLEVNPGKRKLVVSRKALMLEARRESEKELFGKLAKGDKVTGKVKSIKDFGAFVDLGGVDGLLHIGQISWSRIGHPSEVLEVGQDVEVQILDVDQEKKKISLSMRQLAANPWTLAEQKYAIGSTQAGKVTRVADFGAFVMLEPGVEGLIHISQIDHRRVRRVEDELSVGQQVEAKVLEVDPARKRISLSMKALKAAPEQFDAPPPEERRPKRVRRGDLRGGSGSGSKGGLFGDPRDFS